MSDAFSNHCALITGAGARLGKAFALALLDRGVDVVVHYNRSADGANEVVDYAAGDDSRGRAVAIGCDLSDADATAELFARARESIGRPIDWLVNNASIFDNLTAEETDLEQWHRNLQIHLTAPFQLTQGADARRSATNRARSSTCSISGRPTPARTISPTRFRRPASRRWTKSLAQAFAPGIRVNGLALGNILPPVDGSEQKPPTWRRTPAKRRGSAEETVQSLLFLLGGPGYITGHILYLDGGRHLT
jgi:NAD(P)-dependent dehydrogenase (short-subunit alcohol dehydrogenase family)